MHGQSEATPSRIGGSLWHTADSVGRSKEVQRILRLISYGQSVSIVGPAGCGKTWLLNHVARAALLEQHGICAAEHIFLRLSGRTFARVDQLACWSGFCAEILAQFKRVAGPLYDRVEEVEPEIAPGGHRGLRTLFRIARDCGLKPVLVLDDFDDLAQNRSLDDSFFAALRSLATGYEVIYLVASRLPLYELEKARPEASTLCGICQQFLLCPLAEEKIGRTLSTR
jgi:energy-coupling factor transporter ATP-binding protein EcfA2